ncbi:MAG TPA: Glu/Leu/Phe/Val dehydrogenase dimerization domain-containing protein [Thermodesulfobacteriota bacterium]|nr:Glu/Leu/Phe/Val dehydrogenase dimerization domain-containing protein [Thermodesulfobacteriota bacterium]
MLITVSEGPEVLGYVAVDSTVNNRSRGGLRMLPDIDKEEMTGLARAMTLKYGFLGLPQGGAKAGVIYDPEAPITERQERLARFGQAISSILRKRIYIPAADMGTNNSDIRLMLKAVGVEVKARELRGISSGYYTALTVFAAAKEALNHFAIDIHKSSIAIEGFGSVGSELAGLFYQAKSRVVAISTSRGAIYNSDGLDVELLRKLYGQAGSHLVNLYPRAEHIDKSELLELPVDLLSPCARHHSIHLGNVDRVKALIICAGANNPVTPEAERILFNRGVMCLPDFVTNSGGVLGGTMEFASIDREKIADFIERRMSTSIAWLINEANRQGVMPSEIAVPMALHRFRQVQKKSERPRLGDWLFGAGLELYRRGWIPGRVVSSLSLPYFEKSICEFNNSPQVSNISLTKYEKSF